MTQDNISAALTDATRAAESEYEWVRASVRKNGTWRIRAMRKGADRAEETTSDDVEFDDVDFDDDAIRLYAAEEFDCTEAEVEIFHGT